MAPKNSTRTPKPVFNFRLDDATRKELEALAAASTNAEGNPMNVSEYMRALISDAREKGTIIEQEYASRLVERRVARRRIGANNP